MKSETKTFRLHNRNEGYIMPIYCNHVWHINPK